MRVDMTTGSVAPQRAPHLRAIPMRGDGWKMLLKKELLRFWRVALQTVAAPVLTSVLYLLIFGSVLQGHVEVYPGVGYIAFLVPGLVMMGVLQNAFANSASSLVQSKIMGNLVFTLLTPLSAWNWFVAYVGAAVVRGILVGVGIYLITLIYTPARFAAWPWALAFILLGAALMAVLGLLAGLWADKFDQMAVFQNFIVMPMTFLAGVFYSIDSLPPLWRTVSQFNPFFYMIDGFRYGLFGVSDVSPWMSLGVAGVSVVVISALTLYLLKIGYKLRY